MITTEWDVYHPRESEPIDRLAAPDAAAALAEARRKWGFGNVERVEPVPDLPEGAAAADGPNRWPDYYQPAKRGLVRVVIHMRPEQREQFHADIAAAGYPSNAAWLREQWNRLRTEQGKPPIPD